jgi:hypothetical protein
MTASTPPLHHVVVGQLRGLAAFDQALVFPWPHHERTVWADFANIRRAAGIDLPCHEKHAHTGACHLYGFHDLKRASATQNAPDLTGDALHALMRHKTYPITQRCINLSRQLDHAVGTLQVPEFLKATVQTRRSPRAVQCLGSAGHVTREEKPRIDLSKPLRGLWLH